MKSEPDSRLGQVPSAEAAVTPDLDPQSLLAFWILQAVLSPQAGPESEAGRPRSASEGGEPGKHGGRRARTYCRCRCYLHQVPGAGPLRLGLSQAGLHPSPPTRPPLLSSLRPGLPALPGLTTPPSGPLPTRAPPPGARQQLQTSNCKEQKVSLWARSRPVPHVSTLPREGLGFGATSVTQ